MERYDVIIVGGGVSGSFIAQELTATGKSVLLLEAGRHFTPATFPRNEMDANAQLYWSGGAELNSNASLAFLRPKVVGGGTIVNQALLDRFSDEPLESWKSQSNIEFFSRNHLDPYYEKAESNLSIQQIPKEHWNENAKIFTEGFDKSGYKWSTLNRAQKDCRFEDGSDCIECLGGCPIESKQSTPVTTLKRALENGLTLISEFEVTNISDKNNDVTVYGMNAQGNEVRFKGKSLVLASGAIGNSIILQKSGFKDLLPAIGEGFYTHPQEMVLALFEREINAFKGGFQAVHSSEPSFKQQGFKLENVFGPPASLAMVLPHRRKNLIKIMSQIKNLACIEVAVRDTVPGKITASKRGNVKIVKKIIGEDKLRKERGLRAIHNIFEKTGAKEVFDGSISIGLHLMGGCAIGKDRSKSVVDPDFRLHGHQNIFIADSSIFPNAPGHNPSLTIMALAIKASEVINNHVA